MSLPTLQRPNQVGSDPTSMLQDRYDTHISKAYDYKGVLSKLGIPRKELCNGGNDAAVVVRYGKVGTSARYKALGATIPETTVPHATVSGTYDARLFNSVAVDMDEEKLVARYSEKAQTTQAMTDDLVNTYEQREHRLLAKAAFGAATVVHSGGITKRKTAATVAAAYALTSSGATALYDDMGEILDTQRNRTERIGSNLLWIGSTYAKRVLMKEPTLMNSQTSSGGDYATARLPVCHNIPFLDTIHLPRTNVTSDLAAYNGNFLASDGATDATVGVSVFGEPVVLLVAYDAEHSPLMEASPDSGAIAIWSDVNGNRYVSKVCVGQRYGLSILDANCVAGIFVKTAWPS